MKVGVLCNGASRSLFTEPSRYDYLIGCNIPWTKVDSTVIMDVGVLEKLEHSFRFYCSRTAWREVHKKEKYVGGLIELFDSLPEYDSTGHAAARIVLSMGATEVDIYGCDSWWENNTESYTHKYIDSRSNDMTKNVSAWRANWYKLMSEHKEVVFNFIGEPK